MKLRLFLLLGKNWIDLISCWLFLFQINFKCKPTFREIHPKGSHEVRCLQTMYKYYFIISLFDTQKR